jgi:hypothetical protein
MSDADESAFEALSVDERRCLHAFAVRNVRFVVVGGYAVRYYGRLRAVLDLDLLIEASEDNLDAVAAALADLGVDNARWVTSEFRKGSKKRWRWRDGQLDHYVDLLTGLGGWPYREVEADSISVPEQGLLVQVLSRARLIADKRASSQDPARGAKAAVDLEDLRYLQGGGAVEQGDEADER